MNSLKVSIDDTLGYIFYMSRCRLHMYSLYPLVPRYTLSVDKAVLLKLRAFKINNIPVCAVVVLNPLLLNVKLIEFGRECVLEGFDVALRVKSLPRLHTGLSSA